MQEEIEEGCAKARKEGRSEGLKEGMLSAIRNLMDSLSISAQKAMDTLKIPPEEQKTYAAMI